MTEPLLIGTRGWDHASGGDFYPADLPDDWRFCYYSNNLRSVLVPIASVLGAMALLILYQPDLGTTVSICIVAFAMLFAAGLSLQYLALSALVVTPALYVLVWMVPYRKSRVLAFMDPWADPYDSGFQLTQSLIAIGRGEWFGVGLGDGVQKLFYLPEAHTDFVFAVFAEEFGLLGSVVLIALFLALLWRVFKLAMRAADSERFFEAFLAIGLGTWLGLQAFINVGVNMGLLPTKGLTLPLISYGRSSMIVAMIAIGLLLRIHHELAVDAKPVNRKRRRKS